MKIDPFPKRRGIYAKNLFYFMKKPVLFLVILGVVIVGLLLVNITISNTLSTSGIAIDDMQTKLSLLQHQDTLMEEKILKLSSYTRIASQAATLGFAPEMKEVTFSDPTYSLAYQQ